MDCEFVAHPDSEALIAALTSQLTTFRSTNDAPDRFPAGIIDMLRRLGILAAPLPRSDGGAGWGTEAAAVSALCTALRGLGYTNLAAGRIFEAHVNALALIFRYGEAPVRAVAARAARDGALFALWVAPAKQPVRAVRHGSLLRVIGRKAFCTAGGYVRHAVITALNEQDQEQMILVDAADAEIDQAAPPVLHGMRGAATAAVNFDCTVPIERCIGGDGDYLREPDFSVGAWRTSAVTVGGLRAMVEATILQLRARGRHTNPHQAARIGQMLIKLQTATAWVSAAAEQSCHPDQRRAIGTVNLARIAIEQACLDVIPLVQRSLGLAGFLADNPVEPMMRDLATYLRQPAGDEVLVEAAIAFAEMLEPSILGDLP
jgi:alkylation response protein AidB-like acyl-CoA dehydrogenase